MTDTAASERVLAYHRRTKHQFDRYAAGPPGLDWNTQPDPFRRYEGAPVQELPLLGDTPEPAFAELYVPGAVPPRPLGLVSLAALFQLAFGLSAWKRFGEDKWALRCNPSSGNLHPTEAYAVAAGCPGLDDGVHHYVSRDHLLERRCGFTAGTAALPPGLLLVGLSSVHWREAWKYGERAYRYCQHDVGHAIAALRYAAAVLGWRVHLLDAWGDADLAALLGLARDADYGDAEREHPDVLLRVDTGSAGTQPDIDALLAAAAAGQWLGRANALSGRHEWDWPVIEETAAACTKPRTAGILEAVEPRPALASTACALGAVELIRQRRSAQTFDGSTAISAADFFRLLDVTLPRPDVPPWDAVGWAPRLHLLLFVHRVEGLPPGLYVLPRRTEAEALLRAALSAEYAWERGAVAPAHLPLFRLLTADARKAARALSCHQDIAAHSAFSLGMLAEFADELAQAPWRYRRLFWEAGMIGQALYLEAEAAGLRGTGIGCFFDDPVHELLGIQGETLQSLYHFTVGGARVDARLQTLPPYGHLADRAPGPA